MLSFLLQMRRREGIYSLGSRVVKDGVTMICCAGCRNVREVQFCSRCLACSSCLGLSASRAGNESAALLFGLSNNSVSDKVACPRCRQYTIESKAPESGVQSFETTCEMAQFEDDFGEIASPEWFDGDDFVYND